MNDETKGPMDAIGEPAATPSKYDGKTPAEIAKMHSEAESMLGRQASEIGQLRAQLTAFQSLQAQTPAQPQTQSFEETFYDNPQGAVDKLVQEKLGPLEAQLQQQRLVAFQEQLTATRKNWREEVQSPEFQNFVVQSPLYTELYQRAESSLDSSAAKALFEAWDKRDGAPAQAAAAPAQRRAVTEAGGPASVSGKIYRRSELQALRANNPAAYEANLGEIKKAYMEGRVKDG